MKMMLTISKKWHHPQFKFTVTNEELSCEMDFEDFVKALKQEIGSVTWTFKKDAFEKQLDEAIQRVVSGAKEESAKIWRRDK